MRMNIVKTNPSGYAPITCSHWVFHPDILNYDGETGSFMLPESLG